MEHVYYGDFTEEEKGTLDALETQWTFWKVENKGRYGYYAWNFEWEKNSRIMSGNFSEFRSKVRIADGEIARLILESLAEEEPQEKKYRDLNAEETPMVSDDPVILLPNNQMHPFRPEEDIEWLEPPKKAFDKPKEPAEKIHDAHVVGKTRTQLIMEELSKPRLENPNQNQT